MKHEVACGFVKSTVNIFFTALLFSLFSIAGFYLSLFDLSLSGKHVGFTPVILTVLQIKLT